MSDIIGKPFTQINAEADAANADENIVKLGEDVNLTAKEPTLRNISIRAGWDARSHDGQDIDMDVSLLFLNSRDQTIKDEDFIFYNNHESYSGAVKHKGDSRHGAGDGDDEEITIDLYGVPFDYVKVMIIVSIYRGGEMDHNLGDVKNAYVRIVNDDKGEQLVRYKLDSDFKDRKETAVVAAVLDRMGSQWTFRPVAEFAKGGLGEIAARHGMIVGGQSV